MREMKSSSSQKEGIIQQQPSGNDGGTALDLVSGRHHCEYHID